MSPHRRPRPADRLVAGPLLALGLILGSAAVPPAGIPAAAAAVVHGSVAPNFTKTELGGGPVSLASFSGKVVVLFLLGYS